MVVSARDLLLLDMMYAELYALAAVFNCVNLVGHLLEIGEQVPDSVYVAVNAAWG